MTAHLPPRAPEGPSLPTPQPAAQRSPSPPERSLGAELEMGVIDADGRAACVDDRYFEALAALKGGAPQVKRLDGRIVGLRFGAAENGIDNGFNLLETAHDPVRGPEGGLAELGRRIAADLAAVRGALAGVGLQLTSLAQHPGVGTGAAWYRRAVAPKPVYRYLTGWRGWDHAVGIDAKAQNGPTTGLAPGHAVDALNLALAAAPAFIALFANSPLEAGRPTGLKETRMTLWPRMLARSRIAADATRVGQPTGRFRSLAAYFRWTFGPGTVMHAVPAGAGGYKCAAGLFIAGTGATNALDFLAGGPVTGHPVGGGEAATLRPQAQHFAFLQWSNFLDMRLRFTLGPEAPEAAEIAAAMDDDARFDALFAGMVSSLWMENRCAGVALGDAVLAAEAGPDCAGAAVLAPSALQAGLVAAAGGAAAHDFLARHPPARVMALRRHAVRHALDAAPGVREAAPIRAFCSEVLDLARAHLPAADRAALTYADWVLASGRTAADRALEGWARSPDPDRLALRHAVR